MRARHPRPDVLTCEVCGAEFPRRTKVAACCSVACRQRRRYLRNKAAHYEASRAWKAANRDAVKASGRAYYARNREAFAERYLAARDRRRAKKTAYMRRWRAANPEAIRAIEWRRRHAIRNNPDSRRVTQMDWERLVGRFDGCCAYCGEKSDDLHLDHVVPVSRGGRHGIGNALPACPGCNQSKTNFLLIEWRLRRRKAGLPLRGLGDVVTARQAAA
jgi:5-methylcytosine-specific restriction endonuclease McrA